MAAAYQTGNAPLSRREYDELVRRGALEDAHVELLYGRIVSMSPIGKPHRYSVTRLAKLFIAALGDRAAVHVQSPFAAPNESEPEPDVAVVAPGDYLDEHPKTAWLIIEVAESSLARDREKARLYAAAAVPEYWIVNLVEGVVEVHRDPQGDRFGTITRHGRADVLRPVAIAGVEVAVANVLPPEGG